eukprot:Hpha_TRINITY_DN15662_c5_g1::TRINITY_DN15662_c5_g1_i1::g.99193::m.99193
MAGLQSMHDWSQLRGHPSFHPCIPGIAKIVEGLICKNDKVPVDEAKSYFDGVEVAPVSVSDYLFRLCAGGGSSAQVWPMILVYIRRISRTENGRVTSRSVHRILATAYMLAGRYHDEISFRSWVYALLAGVPQVEMNVLCCVFLKEIDWKLHVSLDQFASATQMALLALSDPPPEG